LAAPQQTAIVIGKYRLAGRPAQIVLLALLAGAIAWIAYLRPSLSNWPVWVSMAGWVAFTAYWGAAAKNSAEAKRSESAGSRRVHEILVNVALLLLFVPVPGLRQSFLPHTFARVADGLTIQAAFFGLAVWARLHLGRNWSGRIEIKVEHELIRSGPYRILRHPIYTAMLGMYVGTAVTVNQAHALLGVAMVMFAYWRKIRMEEANLRSAFGPRYEEYRRATWSLIPGVY